MSSELIHRNTELEIYNIIKNNVLPLYALGDAQISQIKIKNTDKQRAVYKITHENKNYCLKKVYYNDQDLLFIYSAMEWLYRNGIYVPKLLPTTNGSRFVKSNNMIFILTPWINGEKCNFDNINNITNSIKNLANMHKCSVNFFPIEGSTIKEGYDNIYISTSNHFNKILQSYNEASKIEDNFSKLFLSRFEDNYSLAKYSTNICSLLNMNNLSKTLCHGDYVNKNIIFQGDKTWVIDFDNCSYDYVAKDISYFLRRLLKRTSTKWNIEIAQHLLITYNNIFSLNEDDIKYILAYLAFPQKYWRLSKDYYSNIKKCNKIAFFDLLEENLKKTDSQIQFIKELETFITTKLSIKLT